MLLVLWAAVLVAIYVSVRTTAQFFVLAAVVAVIMGGSQALIGLALQFTRSYRLAIRSLTVFFAAGLVVLARVDIARGARQAGA